MSSTAVDRLLVGIEHAVIPGIDAFGDHAILDATVPDWRSLTRGRDRIEAVFARWFRDPGRFEELRRTLLPFGELVEFTLAWEEHGVPHAARQAHALEIVDGQIVADTMWCGGRWPASLLAEMEDAARVDA